MTLYEARRMKTGAASSPIGANPRALRLPIGFVVIVAAIVLALAVAVYLVGYRVGYSAAERIAIEAGQGPSRTNDPLLSQAHQANAESMGASGDGRFPARSATPSATNPGGFNSSESLGAPPSNDPRVVGLNYFTIASEIQPDRAHEMVAFCRGIGLDAIAISGSNARLQVIVLPGFGGSDLGGAPAKALEAKIRAVGAKWKALGRGNGDFHDCYQKLFKGSS
ncbi:MAG: hypothetical protein EXS15_05260 [Phycisphaerales bacterium]|nr:hypothetical protein [Phycisphaerales bacterium]